MKGRLLLVALVAAMAFAAAAVSPSVGVVAFTSSASAKTCAPGFTHAVVSWSSYHRCLRQGQYCKKVRNPEYRKYGFLCVNGKLRKLPGARKG
jgi:hypothetical protein